MADRADLLRRYREDPAEAVLDLCIMPSGKPLRSHAEDWQVEHQLRPRFARGEDGLPRWRLLYWGLGKGWGKTTLEAGCDVVECELFPGTEVYRIANDQEQADLALAIAWDFLRRQPLFAGTAKRLRGRIEFTNGSLMLAMASDAPSLHGIGARAKRFRGILDELHAFTSRELVDVLIASSGKAADSQLIITTNPGHDTASVCAQLREAARTSPKAYFYEPAALEPVWIKAEWRDLMRATLPPSVYDRFVCNVWTPGEGAFLSPADLARCTDEGADYLEAGAPGALYYAGLDVGLRRDATALALVAREREDVRLAALCVWQGTPTAPVQLEEVEAVVREVARRFRLASLTYDPWQCVGTAQRLVGVAPMREFTFSQASLQKLASTLYGLVRQGRLRMPPDPDLQQELLGLQVVPTPTGFKFDHARAGKSDQAIALAMAAQAAMEAPAPWPEDAQLVSAHWRFGKMKFDW